MGWGRALYGEREELARMSCVVMQYTGQVGKSHPEGRGWLPPWSQASHQVRKAGAAVPLVGLCLLGPGETLTIFLIPYSPRDLEGAEAVMIPTCCVPHPSTDPREPRAFGDDGEDPRAHPITHDPPDKVRIAPSGLSCLGLTWQSCCPDLPAGSGQGPLPCFAAVLHAAAVFPTLRFHPSCLLFSGSRNISTKGAWFGMRTALTAGM